ncbi:MAG: ubiquinol-cytochrome c reductase iron-sulfur subunit [Desulfatibacillaceae bacterium]
MAVKTVDRSVFQRILGIPATPPPVNPKCWTYGNGRITIDLDKAPELSSPGGALRLEKGGLPERVLVVRGENDDFKAYRNRCTHVGHRRLDPVPGTNMVQCCSVSKSTFDAEGRNVSGPGTNPVDTYAVEKDGNRLTVILG